MTKEEYEKYLESPRWRILSRFIHNTRKVCEKCAFPYELNVHHKTYVRLGHEKNEDLILLCRSCHSREHFVESFEGIPDFLLTDLDKGGVLKRIELLQKEAKKKNLQRQDEIRKNKEQEDQ